MKSLRAVVRDERQPDKVVLAEVEKNKIKFHDFSSFFSEFEVKIYDESHEDRIVFYDKVHLSDYGRELVARRINSIVGEATDSN